VAERAHPAISASRFIGNRDAPYILISYFEAAANISAT
jgi:hypothetical protein